VKIFFIENFLNCCQNNEYLDLDKDLFKMALDAGEIDADSATMFIVIRRWARFNSPKLEQSVDDIMIDLLPPKTLFNQNTKYRLLSPKPFSPSDLLWM